MIHCQIIYAHPGQGRAEKDRVVEGRVKRKECNVQSAGESVLSTDARAGIAPTPSAQHAGISAF